MGDATSQAWLCEAAPLPGPQEWSPFLALCCGVWETMGLTFNGLLPPSPLSSTSPSPLPPFLWNVIIQMNQGKHVCGGIPLNRIVPLQDTLTGHPYRTPLQDTLTGHPYRTPLQDTLKYKHLDKQDTIAIHKCHIAYILTPEMRKPL